MHRLCACAVVAAAVFVIGSGQPSAPPLDDTRLSVHTLVLDDIFAGMLDGDEKRLSRGEKNIEVLFQQRPADRPALLVWKACVVLHRGIAELEAFRLAEFDEKYAQAIDLVAQAKKLAPNDQGVTAVTAGMYAFLADKLPETARSRAWASAYEAYQALWQQQGRFIEKLPVHQQGELLGGLAQSAQRTGRTRELAAYLDKIIAVAPESPYAQVARQWQENPKAATRTRLTCLTCHAQGRLSARRAALPDR
jgi:tetratricopeptide (TPR) repeat protein